MTVTTTQSELTIQLCWVMMGYGLLWWWQVLICEKTRKKHVGAWKKMLPGYA